ncbi:uncharacterized protein LOC144110502 isoform X2 [Amblyomma americanum]
MKPPCVGTGGGDECGPPSEVERWPLCPPGECGDVTADGAPPYDVVDRAEEAFSDSVSAEYLTPAGSLHSLEFCSTLDMLAEEEVVEEKRDEDEQEQPSPPGGDVTPATPTSSSSCSASRPASPSLDEEERDEPVARILDVCGQRVDFRNTPSALSLLSDASSIQRSYFLGQGYRSLASSSSSSESIDSSAEASTTSSCSRPATIGVNSSSSNSSGADARSCRSAGQPGPLSSLSSGKLMLPWLHDPLEPRIKQRRRPAWTRLWTAFCRRMRQWTLRRRHGRRKRRANDGSQRLCDEVQAGTKDDDYNVSSDEFYTVTARWDIRRLYQRCVSYLHVLWCRNGS